MKTLTVDSSMRALFGGAFYPSGHTMVMYPSDDSARNSAQKLFTHGFTGNDVQYAPPDVLISQIAPTVDVDNAPLPSAGTDGNTARELVALARQGQTGLLIATPDDDAFGRLKQVLKDSDYSIARHYYKLAIEDL